MTVVVGVRGDRAVLGRCAAWADTGLVGCVVLAGEGWVELGVSAQGKLGF